jgi:hypothetical protein
MEQEGLLGDPPILLGTHTDTPHKQMTTPVDTSRVDEIIGKILGGMSVDGGKRRCMGGESLEGGDVEAGKKGKKPSHRSRRRRHARGGETVPVPEGGNVEGGKRHRRMHGGETAPEAANVEGGKRHRGMYGGETAPADVAADVPAPEGGRSRRHKGHKSHKMHTPSVAGRVKKAMSGGETAVVTAVEGGEVDGGRKVYTAANGAKYVKNSKGQVRFIKGASPSYMRRIRSRR